MHCWPRRCCSWKRHKLRAYGARKLWKAARRAGMDVCWDQVACLMRQLDVRGVNRTKTLCTSRSDSQADRHPDPVDRECIADRPNAHWVTDLERHGALLNREKSWKDPSRGLSQQPTRSWGQPDLGDATEGGQQPRDDGG